MALLLLLLLPRGRCATCWRAIALRLIHLTWLVLKPKVLLLRPQRRPLLWLPLLLLWCLLLEAPRLDVVVLGGQLHQERDLREHRFRLAETLGNHLLI